MANKLSFSQVNTYTTCGRKYQLHYRYRYRERFFHSALAYGSAIDAGLNELLTHRDLKKAKDAFDRYWNAQIVNGVPVALSHHEDLVYAERDFDPELLTAADLDDLENFGNQYLGIRDCVFEPICEYNLIKEEKTLKGFANLAPKKRQYYNYANWLCLLRKGHIMLDAYNRKVLPKIKNVLAVQHTFQLENSDKDIILAVADFICQWEDGSIMLLDNKTSSREYEPDQAARSAQLIVYYHKLKEEFKLDKVGFVVLNKNIIKNRTKICAKCGYNGSGTRYKTCPDETVGDRCNGEWLESISADCMIQFIFDRVTDTAEELVLTTFDEANQGIKQGNFYKNLNACKQGPIICPFYRYCWFGDESDIVKL